MLLSVEEDSSGSAAEHQHLILSAVWLCGSKNCKVTDTKGVRRL
jgi:hypothetical protein